LIILIGNPWQAGIMKKRHSSRDALPSRRGTYTLTETVDELAGERDVRMFDD